MSYVLFYIFMFIVLTCIFAGHDSLTDKQSREAFLYCIVWPAFLLFMFVHIVFDAFNSKDGDI